MKEIMRIIDDGNVGDDDWVELVRLIIKYVNTRQQLE